MAEHVRQALHLLLKHSVPLALACCALLWGYRILLHPLAVIPGPFLCKFTDAYAGYFAARQILPYKTWQNHVKYGPMVRLGPNRVTFNTTDAIQDIYNSDNARKSFVYELTTKATGTINIFNAMDDHLHRRKRRLVGHAISDRAMQSFEPAIQDEIHNLLGIILKVKGEPLNATVLTRHLTMDIVALLAFAYPLKTQTKDENRWLSSTLVTGNAFLNNFINFPILHYANMDWLIRILAKLGRVQYEALIHRMVQWRKKQKAPPRSDLYSSVTAQQLAQGKERMEEEELWQEASFFISAGADTTSAALSALLFYLSRHKDVYNRLTQEIRSAFPDASDITGGPTLFGCKYLRACIDETLRMSPPVGGTLWRQPTNDHELVINGHKVPDGTQVGVTIFPIHHNEEYFPEPFAFRPERWLEADPDTYKRMTSAFMAFSSGPRACAGKAMGYLEVTLVVAHILWHFDFQTAPGKIGSIGARQNIVSATGEVLEDFAMHDVFSAAHDGPYLVFKGRK
jgi:cytochrome P450